MTKTAKHTHTHAHTHTHITRTHHHTHSHTTRAPRAHTYTCTYMYIFDSTAHILLQTLVRCVSGEMEGPLNMSGAFESDLIDSVFLSHITKSSFFRELFELCIPVSEIEEEREGGERCEIREA